MTKYEAGEAMASRPIESLNTSTIKNFVPEPRCHVCRDDVLCEEVNRLLTIGASYALIARTVRSEATGEGDAGPVLSVDSVRNHCHRHFPVQQGARAAYREILERRARENGVDYENSVALAVTPMAFFETVVAKSFQTMVSSTDGVDLRTGLAAADRLHTALNAEGGSADIAGAYVKLDNLIKAVKRVVPESMWPEIAAGIEGS